MTALIAQLGERQTEDLKAPCSIHGQSKFCSPAKTISHFISHSVLNYFYIHLCLTFYLPFQYMPLFNMNCAVDTMSWNNKLSIACTNVKLCIGLP